MMSNAYRTIRVVKEIQRGNRSATDISEKTRCPLNITHYYLNALVWSPKNITNKEKNGTQR